MSRSPESVEPRPPRVLTPAASEPRRFPWPAATALGVVVLLSLVTSPGGSAIGSWIQGIAKLGGLVAGIALAMWLEERLYAALLGRHRLLRLDCTVVGDTANLASRVEGMTKEHGVSLLITAETRDRLADPGPYRLREVARVQPAGGPSR